MGTLAAHVEADPEGLVSGGDTEGSQILQHPQVMHSKFISYSSIYIQKFQYFQKELILPKNNRQKEGI